MILLIMLSFRKKIQTPICLDESIHTLSDAKTAIELNSCKIISIKLGRVGGFTNAITIHDLCVAHHIPVWCGGMLEAGVGRAQSLALATLPGFTLPADPGASNRYCIKISSLQKWRLKMVKLLCWTSLVSVMKLIMKH